MGRSSLFEERLIVISETLKVTRRIVLTAVGAFASLVTVPPGVSAQPATTGDHQIEQAVAVLSAA
jgi:hypothetical protein